MNKNNKQFLIFILLLVFLVGCGQQASASTPTVVLEDQQETVPVEPTAKVEETPDNAVAEEPVAAEGMPADNPVETPAVNPDETAPVPAIAPDPITLNEQPYVSPSNAFSVYLPENWNCSETGQYRVDCHNSDNSSGIIVRAIGTGYELVQENFLSLAQAELVSTYENVKAYSEVSQNVSEGALVNEATWREGGVFWQGIDQFVRSGPAVYYLTLSSTQEQFENNRPAFEEILQKTKLNSIAMSSAPLYAFRKEYISRGLIFNVQVPTSWSKFVDAVSIDRTIVEGFTSPDKRAGVQVAVFNKGSHISQETKASKTLEIMRQLYGWDLRVSVDKALQDGRERLEWYAERKDINGITYFNTVNTSIYIFSIIWDDATKDLYMPVLEEIVDSFTYE